MSATRGEQRRKCISCGINVAGTNAARFPCPSCGERIYRCTRCRKQSTRYVCDSCEFEGP